MDRIGIVNNRIQATQAPVARRNEAPAVLFQEDRYLSPDMAQMLDDIANAEAMLKAAATAPRAAEPAVAPAPVVAGTDLPTAVAAHAVHDAHGHHAHEKKANRMTAGHLGLEAGEMSAKNAGVLGESAGHSAAHGPAHAAAEVKGAVAHGAMEAKGAVAHGAAEAKAHGASEAASGLAEAAEASSVLTAGLLVGGAVGSAVIGVGMGLLGAHQIKEGLKTQDRELVLEGTGATILGARSGLAAVSLAGHSADGLLGAMAHGAHAMLAPLGVVHGAIDAGLGVRKVVQGVKEGDNRKITLGTLTTGFGVALVASAIGGGIPAVAAAGAFLAAKVGTQIWHKRHPQEH